MSDFEIPKHVFHAHDYKGVDSFLAACRNLPLEKVRSDLERYLGLLDAQLVALINQDYAEFVELSASILGTDIMIRSVRSSLGKVEAELQVVGASVETRALALQDRQARLRSAEEERRALQNLATIHQSLGDVEALLRVSEDGALDRDVLSNGAVLDRVITQFTELTYNAGHAQNSRFVQSLRPRITRLEQCVEKALKELFLGALAPQSLGNSKEVLARCLRTYTAIDRAGVPKELFRNLVVSPLVAEIVTVKNLEGGNRLSCDGMGALYDALLQCAVTRVAAVVADAAAGLVQAAFDEVVDQLIGKLGSHIFATGIPETFHRNLVLSKSFVARWESEVLQGKERDVEVFRASEALHKWNRGWKVDVYFTLRAQEIIRSVEQALSQPLILQHQQRRKEGFVVATMDGVAEQLARGSAADVFLPGLEASFLRLGFQIVSRVRTWVQSGLPDAANVGVESPWSGATLPHWVAAHNDMTALAMLLRTGWTASMEQALGRVPPPVVAAVEVAAAEIENQLTPAISKHIVRTLSGECTANLQYVRKISSLFFRADSNAAAVAGGAPETAMVEVESVMSPLRRLWGACSWGVEPDERQRWNDQVGAAVLAAYRELAQEVLVQAAATQKFIQQRNKGEGGTSGMAKIVAQFRLDVARLAAILRDEHGVMFPELVRDLQETVSKYV